jgi:hypothetical protein
MLPHLGPGIGDGAPRRDRPPPQRRRVLRRSRPALAARFQRGSNENTNGLLRQYFPRGTDRSVYSEEHLAAVAHRLNTRPRKTLRRRTPAQVLAARLLS